MLGMPQDVEAVEPGVEERELPSGNTAKASAQIAYRAANVIASAEPVIDASSLLIGGYFNVDISQTAGSVRRSGDLSARARTMPS